MADGQTLLTAAATPTEPVAAAEPVQAVPDTAAPVATDDWRPEPLRGEKVLEKYKTQEDALKALVEAQKLIGKKSEGLVVPGEDAPQEAKDAFNAKLRELRGIPESPDAYVVEPPADAPEGYALDPAIVGAFQTAAHEAGIAPAEFQKLASAYMQMEVAAIAKGRADAKASLEREEAALVKEWRDQGLVPKDKFTEAFKAAQALGLVGKDGADSILGHLGNNTALIKALADNVYPLIAEGKLKGGGKDVAMPTLSPAEAMAKGQELMRDPRYRQGDPEYLREVQAHFAQYGDQIVEQHR